MTASPFRVLVKSPFSAYSGYGNDGFSLARALDRWGAEVSVQPTWLDVPIPADLMHLFGRELRGPFDLTINHWDPANLSLTKEARQATRVAVAWTMWEFANGPTGKSGLRPHCHNRASLSKRLHWFDVVFGYDEVSLASIDPYVPRHVQRGVLQGGYEDRDWKPVERDWHGDRFAFLMHGALNNRKAPFTVVQAFIELAHEHPQFKKNARLLLHTTCPGVFPEMNDIYANDGINIRVYLEAWDKPTLEDFYSAGHVFLCPSHGEGKNLPALEFASTGGAVAVTDFGGHKMWLNEDYAYPLSCTMQPAFARHPELAQWAVVDVAEVKRVMWHTFTHRAEAQAKGDLAARLIPQMCSWDTVIEALFRRLRDLVPGPGEIVYQLAHGCHRANQPVPVFGGGQR